MRVVVQHRSRYHCSRPALLGPQLIRLRPADHTRARIESYQLLVEPEQRLHWLRDPHGNRVAHVTFKAGQAVSELDVPVELAVEINAINPFDFFIDDRARKVPFVYPDGQGRHRAIGPHAPVVLTAPPHRRLHDLYARTWSRPASGSPTNTTPTRRSIAVPLVSVNDDVAEQHQRR